MFERFIVIKPLSRSFMFAIKNPFLMTSRYSIKNGSFEFRRISIEHTPKFHLVAIYRIASPFANFLEMVWYCWNANTHCQKHFFKNFDLGFARQGVFNWLSIANGRPLSPWTSRLVSPKRYARSQRRTVRF